jgi:hypothetical protein
MRHLNRWTRIAIVTDVTWTKYAARLFAFLVSGAAARVFVTLKAREAREWSAMA